MRPDDAIIKGYLHPMTPIPTGEVPRGLSTLRRIQAILFDVYGTLLMSSPGGMDSQALSKAQKGLLRGMIRRYGIQRSLGSLLDCLHRTVAEDHRQLRQAGIDYPEVEIVHVWQRVLGMDDPKRVKAFALEYEMVINPVYPMPALVDLLSACREQNLLMGIISNAQFYTPRILERLLGTSLKQCGFDPQLTFFSYGFRSAKPSDLMFKQAAEVFDHRGVPCESVLYVGNDMRNDILPATSVGFRTALFAGDQRSLRRRTDDPRCRNIEPDMIITDLWQLIVDTHNP
jgi:putative hydrolase of the HAD superfamily